MDLYKDPWLSLVKFVQDLCAEATSKGYGTPGFCNLDAHAHVDELPKGDFLCLGGFSRLMEDKWPVFTVTVGVSTYEDADMLRHVDIMSMVASRLEPEKRISLYDSSSVTPIIPVGHLVVGSPVTVEVTARGNVRSLQLVSARLLTTWTSGYRP